MDTILKPPRAARQGYMSINVQGRYPGGVDTPYVGASGRRSMLTWRTSAGDADADFLSQRQTLIERSRDLERNNAIASGIIQFIANCVVGDGIFFKSAIDREFLGLTEEKAVAWQANFERHLDIWAESTDCDYSRRFNFYQQQYQALYSFLVNGDCWVLLPWVKRPGKTFELCLQLIESDRVCNPQDKPDSSFIAGNENIRGGVEYNTKGVPVAIHVRTPHPGAYSTERAEWKRVPIRGEKTGRLNVLHLVAPARIDSSRGVPLLTPIIETLYTLGNWTKAELDAAQANAFLAVQVKRDKDWQPYDDLSTDNSETVRDWDRGGDPLELAPGMVAQMPPGEEIDVIESKRPNSTFAPFYEAQMKHIGMGVQAAYEVLVKHFQNNYSASRGEIIETWRMLLMRAAWFNYSFNQPIIRQLQIEGVLKGLFHAPGYLTNPLIAAAYSRGQWIGQRQGNLDPLKEAAAAKLRVDEVFSSRTREAAALSGGDYEQIVLEQASEKRIAATAGVTFPGKATARQEADDTEE